MRIHHPRIIQSFPKHKEKAFEVKKIATNIGELERTISESLRKEGLCDRGNRRDRGHFNG